MVNAWPLEPRSKIWGLIGGAATAKAVVSSQAAICVAQFVRQPDHEATIEEFEEVSRWTRGEFIEKGGWD